MSCFCRQEVEALRQQLRRAQAGVPPAAGTPSPQPGVPPAAGTPSPQPGAIANAGQSQEEQSVMSAASWLTTRALPSSPWQPRPEWLAADLPTPRLSREDMATLVLLGTARRQAESVGIDLMEPNEAIKLRRLVTTLNERMKQLAQAGPPPDPGPWSRLAARSEAADQVMKAADSGQLDWTPQQVAAYGSPGGRPMREWLPMLRQIRSLSPLIASATELGAPLESPDDVQQKIAEAVRALRSVSPPPPAEPVFMAQLTAQLQAFARLRQSVGIDPADAGFAAVEQAVNEKTAAAAAQLKQRAPLPENLPYCPTNVAPEPVVRLAASQAVRKLAGLAWKVPPADTLPLLRNGLPATSLAGLMAAAGHNPIRQAPCGAGCDAAKLMRAPG